MYPAPGDIPRPRHRPTLRVEHVEEPNPRPDNRLSNQGNMAAPPNLRAAATRMDEEYAHHQSPGRSLRSLNLKEREVLQWTQRQRAALWTAVSAWPATIGVTHA